MNLSFAGCGFLGIYHLGVAKILFSNGTKFLEKVQRISGASAGALVAAIIVVRPGDEEVIKECANFSVNLAKEIKSKLFGLLTPGINLLDPLEVFLNKIIPPNGHEIATNRLYISVTNAENKRNEIVSSFASKHELVQYLLASSCVPFVTGSKHVTINGKKYYDGGMTDNMPAFPDGRTVLVSPFDGRQDICPRDGQARQWYMSINKQDFRLNLMNLIRGVHTMFPPSDSVLQKYYEQGCSDTKRFLIHEKFYTTQTDEVPCEKS